MYIIMAFDTGFLIPAITAVYSLFMNNNGVHLKILYVELSENARKTLNRLQDIGNGNSIEYIYIEQGFIDRIHVETGRWKPEAFFRYFAVDLFTEIDRVLWLDTDILVRNDLEALYNTDFEEKSFAGVYDPTSHPFERLGLSEYINSGVLLFNLKKLRESSKMMDFWDKIAGPDYEGELPDQDALNMVFYRDIKRVDQIWNTFPLIVNEEADHFIENSCIIHYLSKHKPWKTEDVAVFLALFKMYRTAEVFVNEYWDILDKAVSWLDTADHK